MRAGLQIPEFSVPDMKLAPVAVLPLRTRDNLDVRGRFELAHAPHHFTKNRDLLVKLILVGGMLIMTAAANPEVRTAGLDALRRWLLHVQEPRMQLVLLLYGACSPGSTKGVSTTRPSRRARPSPPYTSFSIVMRSELYDGVCPPHLA